MIMKIKKATKKDKFLTSGSSSIFSSAMAGGFFGHGAAAQPAKFPGLTELQKHKICHQDMNYRNITYSNGKMMLVDYGISLDFNDKEKALDLNYVHLTQVDCCYCLAYYLLQLPLRQVGHQNQLQSS